MQDSKRSVLVTGGGRGLGRAIGERLARLGHRVGLVARTESELEATAAAIRRDGGEAAAFVADVTDREALRRALTRHRDWAGGLDALVCAAGRLSAVGPLTLTDAEAWWHDLETSVRGVANAVRDALPALRGSQAPSISVLVGPGHHVELPYATGYGVAQAALVRLVESLGHELAAERVPIFAVNPGLVLTDLVRRLVDTTDGRRWLPKFNEAFAEGKEVGPEVVAEMVAWLVERRPAELSGRVVAAALAPDLMETRLGRVVAENLGVLRLR